MTSAAPDGATEVTCRSEMSVSADALFAWHERPGAFERLTPGWMPARVLGRFGGIRDGARVSLAVPLGPVRIPWELEHVDYVPGRRFRDVQRRGPFALWEHTHAVEPLDATRSVLEDCIRYRLPAPPLGAVVAGAFARARMVRLLAWRHALMRMDLERHAQHPGSRRVAMTGATGFVGRALVPFLTTGGHEVRTLGRDGRSDVHWDPASGRVDTAALAGCDAVIHLAGAPIAERWTAAHRHAIRESRVSGTRRIAEACARMDPRPEVLVCASAVGIYGDRGDAWLDEASPGGDDYLSEVARAWEQAAAPAREAGIRVVHVRTGIALNPDGGALGKMLLPFQAGLGGRLGRGTQWMSWISREDLVGAIHVALQTPTLAGPVNAVAPEPVTNATFAATLARVLRRPALVPVPAFALRALFGEMAEATILASQRVRPSVLQRAGFHFRHPTLSSALRFELGLE